MKRVNEQITQEKIRQTAKKFPDLRRTDLAERLGVNRGRITEALGSTRPRTKKKD